MDVKLSVETLSGGKRARGSGVERRLLFFSQSKSEIYHNRFQVKITVT